MLVISDEDFQKLVNDALGELPKVHVDNIKNVAILYEEEPTEQQRRELALRNDMTLLGLYEGVPLSQRQGVARVLPDKITLFIGPLTRKANSFAELREEIKHTLWHEIAHYYGLDHKQIKDLE